MNTLGVFSLWGAQRAGVPNRIVHNHSVAGKGETKKNFVKYLLRPFAKIYPTQLCACSESAGRWLYGNSEFRVFNNAIDLEKFSFDAQKRAALRKELGLEGKFVVGHIGRFCYAKIMSSFWRSLRNFRSFARKLYCFWSERGKRKSVSSRKQSRWD